MVMSRPKFTHVAFVSSSTEEATKAAERLIALYGNVPEAEAEVVVALGGDGLMLETLHRHMGDRLAIFSGVDDLALESVFLGAVGWVAGIGLAFPYENQKLWDLMMAKKWDEARELYRWYTPLLHLDVGLKFVQNIKMATQATGYCPEWVRLPRLTLSGADRARVEKVIADGLAARPKI